MIRALLIALCILSGCYGANEYGQGAGSGITPNMGASTPYGIGGDIVSSILGQGFTDLSTLPQTFTRATSGYNPATNVITAPGSARTSLVFIGSHAYQSDLIESPGTNLLAAGSSDRLTVTWQAGNGGLRVGAGRATGAFSTKADILAGLFDTVKVMQNDGATGTGTMQFFVQTKTAASDTLLVVVSE